jgi:transcriptional regulator with XRE-family HTH domain
MTTLKEDVEERLQDIEYKRAYLKEYILFDFSVGLTTARKSKNLTQAGLARLLNVSQSYVSKMESGGTNPTLSQIGKVCAALNIKPRIYFRNLEGI